MPTTVDNIMSRMDDLAEATVDHTFVGMIFGSHGTAKTTLATWLAQNLIEGDERIAFVDSADGWVSLENVPSLKESVTRLAYKGYGDLVALASAIDKKVKKGSIDFGKFRVVIIDEIDSIADDTLNVTVREKHGTRDGEQTPEVEGKDYKPMGDLIRQAIKNFQKAGVHLILVAHDKERKDHRNVTIVGPAISPMLKKSMMELMHVVAHTTVEIKGTPKEPVYSRQIQAQPTALVEGKTRIGALTTKVKMEHEEFIDAIMSWIAPGGSMAADLSQPEAQVDNLEPDEIPTDGIPAAELEDEADEPAFVGTEDN